MRKAHRRPFLLAGAAFVLLALSQTALASLPFFAVEQPPFKSVRADATGGDCLSFGTWDAQTLTCAMTSDLTVPSGYSGIRLEGNGVSLRGQGHTVTGTIPVEPVPDPYGGSHLETNMGIVAQEDSFHKISNLQVAGFTTGILLRWSNDNEVSGTAISGNVDGLTVSSSFRNKIMNNEIRDNEEGIITGAALYGPASGENSFLENTLENDRIYCSACRNNTFIDNTLSGTGARFDLDSPIFNKLSGNVVAGDTSGFNFMVTCPGECSDIMINDVDMTNTVDGKPVYFLVDEHTRVFDAIDAAMFICAGCSDVTLRNSTFPAAEVDRVMLVNTENSTLENLDISGGIGGIRLVASNHNRINGNNMQSTIALLSSHYNTISGNSLQRMEGVIDPCCGIWAGDYSRSTNNLFLDNVISGYSKGVSLGGLNEVVAGNLLSGNTKGLYADGIFFGAGSDGLLVFNNRIENNEIGVDLFYHVSPFVYNNTFGPGNGTGMRLRSYTESASIFNNNFTDNGQHVEMGYQSNAVFHQYPPAGGNHWSGFDTAGDGCLDANSDSFCDSPFVFTGGQDDYPWLNPGAWPDDLPPVMGSPMPSGMLRDSPEKIIIDFAERGISGIDPASAQMTLNGDALSDCQVTENSIACAASGLEPGDYAVGGAVADNAGNTASVSGNFKVAREYYFPWYDNNTSWGMAGDWICVSNAGERSTGVEIYIAGQLMTEFSLEAGGSVESGHQWQSLEQRAAGPVRVVSLDGQPLAVTQRTIYKDSFNEFRASDDGDLALEQYFPWYDSTRSTGMAGDWIMVTNPGSVATDVDIFVDAVLRDTISVLPGSTEAWHAPGDLRGGPVKLVSNEEPIIASQRVIYRDSFTEALAHAATRLDDRAFFPWYDDNSSNGVSDWLLVSNVGSDATEINAYLGDEVEPWETFTLLPGQSRQWRSAASFMGGPLRLESNGQNIIASQRVIHGNSFEEIPATYENELGNVAHFPWYDSVPERGFSNWLMMANMDEHEHYYDLHVGNANFPAFTDQPINWKLYPLNTYSLLFSGLAAGPVKPEIWWFSFPENNPRPKWVVSQRVLYKGSFNELPALYTTRLQDPFPLPADPTG